MVELRPNRLRFPGLFVPEQRFVHVALHELEPALEEQEPNAVRILLRMNELYLG